MKNRVLIIIGISIVVGAILLSSFSIQKDDQEYVLFCTHWIFSDRITCSVLWNESNRDVPVMQHTMAEGEWEYLLSISREDAQNELQRIFDENGKFFMNVKIIGLNESYVLGEKPTFTIVEAGYGIPCTHPKIIVSKEGSDKPHWEYHFVHSCPFFKDGHPILSYVNTPHNNRVMPPITTPGQYTIVASSSYDSSTSRQFTILESDFVYDYNISYTKNENNTGYTSLHIDLNNGNYALDQNSKLIRDVLPSKELTELKQLVDENDLLRGMSSVSHDRDPTCQTCINYEMRVSLGDYDHFVQWQNDKDRLREKHGSVVMMLEELLENYNENENYCQEWCDSEELHKIGCELPILEHLAKYSNLLDEEFSGKYALEDIGLSDGISVEKFNECVDFIFEKRISYEFDATYGGLGNRSPAFLGWNIPDACTNDMVKFLKKHSNMFDNDVPYMSPLGGSVLEYGINADDIVQCENDLLDNRDNEPSWPGHEN